MCSGYVSAFAAVADSVSSPSSQPPADSTGAGIYVTLAASSSSQHTVSSQLLVRSMNVGFNSWTEINV